MAKESFAKPSQVRAADTGLLGSNPMDWLYKNTGYGNVSGAPISAPPMVSNPGSLMGMPQQQPQPQPQPQQQLPQGMGGSTSKGIFDQYMSQIFDQKYRPSQELGGYKNFGAYGGFMPNMAPFQAAMNPPAAAQSSGASMDTPIEIENFYKKYPQIAAAAMAATGGTSIPDYFHPSFLNPGY